MPADTKLEPETGRLHGTLPPGTRLRNYELLSVLGHGGFGITYYARDTALGRELAIKEYLPTSLALRDGASMVIPRSTQHAEDFLWGRDRFLEEGRTLALLDGAPGIVRVHDFLEANGTAYMVMALARGETLEQRLTREGRLPAPAVERVLRQMLDGLEQVHRVGFLHRDIKPANIILDAGDRPTLIDFGASRMAIAGRTSAMTVMYTPRYAAAEQLMAEKLGPWTDIYGVSVTLYHAITGLPPPGALERALKDNYVALASLPLAGFPRLMLEGLDAGLAVRAKDRPQSITDWRLRLFPRVEPSDDGHTIVQPRKVSAPAVTAPPDPPPNRRRQRLLWGGSLIAALALGGGVLAFVDRQSTSDVKNMTSEELSKALEARQKAEAEARQRQEALARQRLEEEATRQRAAAEALARRQAEEEEAARQKAVAEALARRQAEEQAARRKAAAEALAKRQAEDEAARQTAAAEALARRQAEEEAARQKAAAEASARKQAEEEAARRKAAAEALAKKQAEEEAARQKAAAEALARRQGEEEAARQKAAAEALARKQAEEEAVRQKAAAEVLARKQAEEEAARQKAAAEALARKQAEEETARQKAATEALARKQAEDEAARLKAATEVLTRKQAEEEAARQQAAAEASAKKRADEEAARKAEREARETADAEAKAKADADARAKTEAAAEKKTAEAAENALRLTTIDRQRLQVALSSLGFDTRGSDGVFGPRSREMIAGWQQKAGASSTGFVSGAQRDQILRSAAAAVARWDEQQKNADDDKKKADEALKADQEAKARGAPNTTAPVAAAPATSAATAAAPAPSASAAPPTSVNSFDGSYTGLLLGLGPLQSVSAKVQKGSGNGEFRTARCGLVAFELRIAANGDAMLSMKCGSSDLRIFHSRMVGNQVQFSSPQFDSGITLTFTRRGD